ncbi:hypothetical protein PFICI_04627 [Pestalotiopsis fici W106-1]|uniref:Gamma interferon inducible lysosomal thiol reductase n=1 Tax=Pestalotiopsis fici (strain W106-1 / CGMCC3.15140) TaxID=1229662 RepID=W3XC74_PESFW|nr:uncharacterized protein PFICI_04627 [Pestalotiopsis fici W106-1]ETS82751.1 hypothetical protein PFICI_04627 [Pestalotiopsis fici W106-1]
MGLPLMDEKRPFPSRTRSFRRNRPLLNTIIIAVLLFLVYTFRPFTGYGSVTVSFRTGQTSSFHETDDSESATTSTVKGLVPLEAHIMSKCPDARDCLRDMVLPTMMRVNSKVNFTLSFIGKPTDSNDGIACKHGPNECMGNIIELCAAHHYPDPKIYLGFVMCLTRDYKLIPQRELIEDCALEHAVDFELLNDCATKDDGAFGISLLRDSVKRSSDVRLPYFNQLLCGLASSLWNIC